MTSGFTRAMMVLILTALLVGALSAAPAVAEDLAALQATHSWLPWPDFILPGHPLADVVADVLSGEWWRQPPWKIPMMVNALQKDVLECEITAYCSSCPDGGGRYTRWSSRTHRGICAADPKYWGPGSVVWIGPPINEVVIVEDTGGAVKGPDRFDVCMEGSHDRCIQIGRRTATYVPLNRVEPKSRWGTKPDGWHPPVWATPPDTTENGG